jgi:hypothetical protein
MKDIYLIFILVLVFWIQWIEAKDEFSTIKKNYNFSIKQSQEKTSLYYKNSLITQWKNEGFSCDKDWGYSENVVKNAKVCISDELSLRNEWKDWYSFRILYKNYPGYYLYNTRSKILYGYSAFDKVLQNDIWKNGLYYLFSSITPWEVDEPYEVIIQFKPDGTFAEIYKDIDPKSRLVGYELLPQKKIKLLFRTNNKNTTQILTIK